MASYIGAVGDLSWGGAGTFANDLLAGVCSGNWSCNINADEFDVTKFTGSTVVSMDYFPGLVSCSGTINGHYDTDGSATRTLGASGLVTWANGYATNVKEWAMDIAIASIEDTPFPAEGSTQYFKTYLPGLVEWSGTFRANMDDTVEAHTGDTDDNPVVGNVIGGTDTTGGQGTAVFKLLEAGGSDHTLTGNIFATAQNAVVPVGGLAEWDFSYRGNGNLTSDNVYAFDAGATSEVVGSNPAVVRTTEMVMTATTGATLTVNAFPTVIRIRCAVGEPISIDIDWQGTGAVQVEA